MGTVIGTCSNCGGPVTVPSFMIDPVPCCKRCGATAKNPYGPQIEMNAPPAKRTQEQSIQMREHPELARR